MFERLAAPRVFGLPPGVDFPQALVDGLLARCQGQPPEALARVELIVNTERMRRRIRAIFDAGPPRILPRIRVLSEVEPPWTAEIPEPVAPLQRRLELVQLVSGLLEALVPTLQDGAGTLGAGLGLSDLGVAPQIADQNDFID
mgnify:CR=1 FL=1